MATTTTETKMLTLCTSDKQQFQIEETIALQAVTIRNMVEDECASNVIPLPNVNSKIMIQIIEYLKKHVDSSVSKEDMEKFDSAFVEKKLSEIFDIILAANYLNIKNLLDICCQRVADVMKNKSPEWVRRTFNIVNDFTAEEEAKIRKEHEWAFEGVDED
ncbi:unnamed protein product [Ilex paraguariensis]|uniref:SKP1-like protein n=1 Tax=Ilex paraguariensis TaxID=185542 RepID=A0ABC8QXZ2_9AQUA